MPAADARQRIMKAARKLFSRGGRPTVEEITTSARVSRPTFYRIFPSRAHLLDALALEPAPTTRARVLAAAVELLRTHTLADLSMEELAERAHLSRAGLYRLFPGKQDLFRALVIAYSPFKPVMNLLGQADQMEPDELIPALVVTAYQTVAGHPGVIRTLIYEGTSMSPSTRQTFRETGLAAFRTLAAYLEKHMKAGRLRRMSPFIAIQGLVGGVMMHVLMAPIFGDLSQSPPSGQAAVLQLADNWLRGMRP